MSAEDDPEKGLDAGEMITIVDERDNTVVGTARRAEMSNGDASRSPSRGSSITAGLGGIALALVHPPLGNIYEIRRNSHSISMIYGNERRENLPHRASYVFVQAPGGQSETNPDLWVQKRTMIKDYCPGYLDPSTGGVVGASESYEENARRELEEEMGIRVPQEGEAGVAKGRVQGQIRHCFTFHYKDERTNVWGDAWDCVWGGEIVPQPEEVESVHRYPLSELIGGRDKAGNVLKSTPDGVVALKKYAEWLRGTQGEASGDGT